MEKKLFRSDVSDWFLMMLGLPILLSLLGGCVQFGVAPPPSSSPGSSVSSSSPPLGSSSARPSGAGVSGRVPENLPKTRILVLPFLDMSPGVHPPQVLVESRRRFLRELNDTERVIIMDALESPEKIDFSLHMRQGDYDLNSLRDVGQRAGALVLLDGRLMGTRMRRVADPVGLIRQVKTHIELSFRLRIQQIQDGQEIFNTTKTLKLEDSQLRIGEQVESTTFFRSHPEVLRRLLTQALEEFVPQIIETLARLQWQGRVAKVIGDRIFLNVGHLSGLRAGDLLKVSDLGEEIYDPQTGNFIGRTSGRLKGTLEVRDFFGEDGSIAAIRSGGGFLQSDLVELY